jgi:tetratricopeptide (TPR) repeat protein
MARKLRLECYLQLGMLKEAEQEMARITAQGTVDEKTWALLNQCADRYYTLAKEDRAGTETGSTTRHAAMSLAVYRKLADIAGNNPSYKNLYDPIRMRLAELYTMENQLPQAAAIYQERLHKDPNSGDGLYNLARIYEKEEKWEDAYITWNKLARGLKPGSNSWFDARYCTAQALIRLGKPKDACDVIAVTRSNYPNPVDEALKHKFMMLEGEFCTKQGSVRHEQGSTNKQ